MKSFQWEQKQDMTFTPERVYGIRRYVAGLAIQPKKLCGHTGRILEKAAHTKTIAVQTIIIMGFPCWRTIFIFPVSKSSRNSFFIGGEAGPVFQHYTEEFKEEDQKDMSKTTHVHLPDLCSASIWANPISLSAYKNMISFGCRLGVIF